MISWNSSLATIAQHSIVMISLHWSLTKLAISTVINAFITHTIRWIIISNKLSFESKLISIIVICISIIVIILFRRDPLVIQAWIASTIVILSTFTLNWIKRWWVNALII